MMPTTLKMEKINSAHKDYEIVLRDPHLILKDTFRQVKYESETFLKPGSINYGSTILKLDIEGINEKNECKSFHLIAKMFPQTKIQRDRFDSPYTFKKEIFLYDKIVPLYKKLSSQTNCRIFDKVPKFYGARLSMENNPDIVDENAVILLEDLRNKQYYTCDRIQGLDIKHLKITILALAEFHALGFLLKNKDSEVFVDNLYLYEPLDSSIEIVETILEECMEVVSNDPVICKYKHKIQEVFNMGRAKGYWRSSLPLEHPWACIVHGDLWRNNLLFHKNYQGLIDDVKILDFQTYYISSPLRDFIYLMCTTANVDLVKDFNIHLESYVCQMKSFFIEYNLNIDKFSKNKLKKQIKDDAQSMLLCVMWVNKFFIDKEDYTLAKNNNIVEKNIYGKRLREIILLYQKNGWL